MPCGVFRCISVDFGVFRCISVFTLTEAYHTLPFPVNLAGKKVRCLSVIIADIACLFGLFADIAIKHFN